MTQTVLRQILLLATAILLMAGPTFAQRESRVYVQGGVNFSNLAFSTDQEDDFDTPNFTGKQGAHVGIGYLYKSRRFVFTGEVNYTELGTTSVSKGVIPITQFTGPSTAITGFLSFNNSQTSTFEYIEIPLQVGAYLLDGSKIRVRLMAGPWIAFGLGGKYTTSIDEFFQLGGTTIITRETITEQISVGDTDPATEMNDIQFGVIASAAIEYQITDRICLSLEPRFILSLSDATPDRVGIPIDQSLHHRVFTLPIRASFRL